LVGLLVGLLAAPAAQAQAPGVTNADICASTDDDAYPPQRRIEACSALIDTLSDQPTALAAALVNRGTVYWYINKTQLALTDLDRAIALDPKNARAFRERSNAFRSAAACSRDAPLTRVPSMSKRSSIDTVSLPPRSDQRGSVKTALTVSQRISRSRRRLRCLT